MDYPYLVAIALIKEKGSRAMPIGGKSLKEMIAKDQDPGIKGQNIALELLLRLIKRSENNPIQRIAKDNSIFLMQISMQMMQEKIPILKTEWVSKGDTEILITQLKNISEGIWSINYIKHEGIKFNPII